MKLFGSAGGKVSIAALASGFALAAMMTSSLALRAAAEEAPSDAAAQPSAPAPSADTPAAEGAPAPAAESTPAATESAAAPGESAAPAAESNAQNTTSAPPPTAAANAPVSTAVVVNLIRLLVQEGVLTQAKADALIRQAQDEADAAAKAQAAGPGGIAVPVPTIGTAPAVTGTEGAEAQGEGGTAPAAGAPTPAQGELPKAPPPAVHVQYVPEIVKKQITDQVRQEVMQQAKDEHWAEPDAMPEWTKRISFNGDFRLRYEWDLFDKRNSPFFPDFQALNAGNPFDLNNQDVAPLPVLNTTDDRQRPRIRARLGMMAQITDEITAGFRLATGNTTNPVSTNQTLGTTLANDTITLDRAYLEYQPTSWLKVFGGRFENPWFYTDLVWDPDLNFDGIAAQYAPHPNSKVSPFLTVGLFSIESTPFNFPDKDVNKAASHDKWMYGAQAGVAVQPKPEYGFKAGLAYYDYQNIQGELSSPCATDTGTQTVPCDTDDTRPGFIQFGNTLFPIRNLVSSNPAPPDFEFFGLASKFRELNATFQFDYAKYNPLHLIFDADFVTNLAFDRAAIEAKNPVNNRGATALPATTGPWEGGANGYMARFTFGYPHLEQRWDWNVYAAYKYIESDAVVDAFTDSDFHLGGTNAKGYIFGGGLGIAHNVDLSARWLSASEITGPPFSVDVIQLDLNGHF
jgi:hypothetical protein